MAISPVSGKANLVRQRRGRLVGARRRGEQQRVGLHYRGGMLPVAGNAPVFACLSKFSRLQTCTSVGPRHGYPIPFARRALALACGRQSSSWRSESR